jgi:hypothetical protein
MYGWLWRVLPGPALLRALLLMVLAAGVVLALFVVVFPAVEPSLPFAHITVDQTGPTGGAP